MTTTARPQAPIGGIAHWLSAKDAAAYIGRSESQLDAIRNSPSSKLRVHPCRAVNNPKRITAYKYDPASLDAFLYREATQDERNWK